MEGQPQQPNYGMVNVDASILNRREQIDFNKYIQDMNQVINDLDLFLAGVRVEKNAATGEWVKFKTSETPIMNEEGREWIKARLRTYLNPNTYMSGLAEKDAAHSYRLDIVNFGCDLYGDRLKYNMTRAGARKLLSLMAPVMWFALRKAETDKKAIYEHMNSANSNPTIGVSNPLAGLFGGGGQRQGGSGYG